MKKLLFAILLFSTMCYAENSKNTETIDNQTSIVSNYNNPYKYVGEIKYYIVINTLFETLKDSQKDFYGRFSQSLYTKDNRYFFGNADIYYLVYTNDKRTFCGYDVSRYRYACRKGNDYYFFNM